MKYTFRGDALLKLLYNLRSRLGEFWWWSLLLFAALRCGDLINAVVGLWLVPKYVPQSELGAVLPLLQVTGVFGLPITILVVTFTKFLNEYKTRGEDGKVKSLIRTFWFFSVVAVVLGTAIALWLMPHFFERIRVAKGSLGVLIIATAVLSTTAPVFANALQALKKFKAMTVMNLFCAPIRLVTMLITMPIRALSGYMVGQAAPYAFQIVWSWFSLRHELRSEVKPEPFLREDGRRILKYVWLVICWYGIGTVLGGVQSMIIRQRLPEVESAAYYMISRFSELATYAGLTLAVVFFPLAAEAHVKGRESMGIFYRSTLATVGFAAVVMAGLYFAAPFVFSIIPNGADYLRYLPDMLLLAMGLTLFQVSSNFAIFEAAGNRFGFLWYGMPLATVNLVFIVSFTGYEYFRGIFPDGVVDWMGSLHIATLRNYILTLIVFGSMHLACNTVQLLLRRGSSCPER